jgi:hypothetical protein
MIPVVQDWCRDTGLNPRALLMPLSFATILGGTNTLIGTSTNLVVSGQLETFVNNKKNQAMYNFTSKDISKYKFKLFDLVSGEDRVRRGIASSHHHL